MLVHEQQCISCFEKVNLDKSIICVTRDIRVLCSLKVQFRGQSSSVMSCVLLTVLDPDMKKRENWWIVQKSHEHKFFKLLILLKLGNFCMCCSFSCVYIWSCCTLKIQLMLNYLPIAEGLEALTQCFDT